MWVRFEHEMHNAPFTPENDGMSGGARVIVCRTLADWRYRVQWSPPDSDSSVDESKLRLLLIYYCIVEYAVVYALCPL